MNYSKNKIIIFGTGEKQKEFEKNLSNTEIAFYLDNDQKKQETIYNNLLIKRPQDCTADDLQDKLIVIASSFYSEISEQLIDMGMKEYVDFIDMYEFLPLEKVRLMLDAPEELDNDFLLTLLKCKKYTMTSFERIFSLYQSIKYIVKNNIEGDIVECGVWKGGSMMICAHTLIQLNATDRKLYLYDTFSGMSAPTDIDISLNNESAEELWLEKNKALAVSPKNEVIKNMESTGYPMDNIFFIEGMVEETIPKTIPHNISLLRLDTDWFESTYHELNHLYPKLSPKGVLIIDDYGHWKGSKIATDQYIEENNLPIFLHKIDYTARLAIKIE
ncbi:TylF/MycF/NovP-related O-methyltransferase [Paenibacillus sp. NPDC057934]|uniref:TylF/MycF/NovP-related O-methyltransferase n=1 Tax=Paenibacillus sp. NPDC057934 TaxID=3346282 RepID=UPI0036DEA7F1